MSAPAGGHWSHPSAPIRALTSGYASPYREEKPLAFLRAFVDDSASDVGEQRLFMAGYVARADTWELFADTWADALMASPSITYLRMVEANGRRGEFQGWDERSRDIKLLRLSRIIRYFEPLSFEFSINRQLYYRAVKPVAARGLGNPYFPCAYSVVSGVARFIKSQNIRLPIEFIFDEQREISADINLFFEWMKASLPKEVRKLINGNPLFRDDKLFLPLQAADMIAWHIRREHEMGGSGLGMANALRNPDGHIISHIDDNLIRSWSKKIPEVTAGTPPPQSKAQWRAAKLGIARALSAGFVPPYGSRWKNALHSALKRLAGFIGF